ncbi:MAG: cysteine desulfurase [Erysipelotrichaceae bacterium]|nr:cysteine desulfurase [Erysipelotrichaceae bacterium]
MIYFDNAATTSVDPEVVRVYTALLKEYGNPDSLHALGRSSSQKMEESRRRIASMLGVQPEEILFTGSASESNTLAIVGYALANRHRGRHLITSNAEHSSVQHAMEFLKQFGFEVTCLPINEQGIITPDALKQAMCKETILVSVMHINNEMGAVNPIAQLADTAHQNPTCAFHADCTQSFAKVNIPFEKLDLMTMSAHKIHGLKGSAMLLKKKNIRLMPVIQGGQQEQGLRGGTENAPANIILAKTIRLALDRQKQSFEKASALRDYLVGELSKLPGFEVLSPEGSAPYVLNIAFESMTSQVLQNALDAKGICISAKSTCSSHESGANPVLLKMGKSQKQAEHGIRLSFSHENTLEEAKAFVKAVKEIINAYGLPL